MKKNVTIFAPPNTHPGELSQIKGLAHYLSAKESDINDVQFDWLRDICFDNLSDRPLKRSEYATYELFAQQVKLGLDDYFGKHLLIPDYFIMAYTQADNQAASSNVDAMCRVVKEYYQSKDLGQITTVVLTSRLYDYKFVDAVNVPNHLIDEADDLALLDKADIHRFFVSAGIIHDLSRGHIAKHRKVSIASAEIEKFNNGQANVVFCLGGRVEGPEICFNLEVVKKLYNQAVMLSKKGYNIIFTSGSRTPSEVCDYLYEKTLCNPDIYFYNHKDLAGISTELQTQKWRIYSGKYEAEFRKANEKVGNIYPGILDLKNTLVVHSYDSFASCETASSAVPTAIFRDFFIDREIRPDCHRLAEYLINQGYAIDFTDFDGAVNPLSLGLKVLPNVNQVFAAFVKEIHHEKQQELNDCMANFA